MKLKLFVLTIFAAAAAMAQLNPRIPLGVTPGISQSWIAAGQQPSLYVPPAPVYTPPPVYTQPLTGYSSQIGNTTWYNFSNGVTGTASPVGNTTWYNFSGGGLPSLSGYSSRIGNTTWYNFY